MKGGGCKIDQKTGWQAELGNYELLAAVGSKSISYIIAVSLLGKLCQMVQLPDANIINGLSSTFNIMLKQRKL